MTTKVNISNASPVFLLIALIMNTSVNCKLLICLIFEYKLSQRVSNIRYRARRFRSLLALRSRGRLVCRHGAFNYQKFETHGVCQVTVLNVLVGLGTGFEVTADFFE